MKSLSEQASRISVFLVITITIFKFTAYLISGSLTVYSEAWHGFSDLFTTLLIFTAIKISNTDKNKLNKKAEISVAIFIGIILTYISLSIMYNVIFYKKNTINHPFSTGLSFIIFSFTSYFLYKFQTKVGKLDNSVALIADGQHSKSDMITSLITGFSLILESRGISIDRYSAALLSLVIMSFAVELIFTTFKTLNSNQSLISGITKNKGGKKYIKISFTLGLIVFLILNTNISIPFGSEGIQFRFGKKYKILPCGKHFILPPPIDNVVIIDKKRIKTVNIGNIASGPLIWSKKHGKTITEMITGDNNFIVPYIKIDYNIKNTENYYLNYKNIKKLISDIGNNHLNKIMLSNSFKSLLLNRKWIFILKDKIQKKLDKLSSGVNIITVTVQDIHPPKSVSMAFENLIATEQQLKTLNTRSKSYRSLKIMSAKTEAASIISKAETESIKKTAKAKAKSEIDELKADIFNEYPEIVKIYLFLNMVENTILNNKKILLDPKSNIELRFENKGKK